MTKEEVVEIIKRLRKVRRNMDDMIKDLLLEIEDDTEATAAAMDDLDDGSTPKDPPPNNPPGGN